MTAWCAPDQGHIRGGSVVGTLARNVCDAGSMAVTQASAGTWSRPRLTAERATVLPEKPE